ncbi:hypothetical protein OCU04_000859 [Sclerotinia nivalis]|uniref:Uncharacterized protein n=1 Tax=Sclerotinia nivalis TaxID=352851 RepID=A0A9X0DQ74_9HELO|nr:hypothetical protein OCU04_000859 [Sclerotinia nivalis]
MKKAFPQMCFEQRITELLVRQVLCADLKTTIIKVQRSTDSVSDQAIVLRIYSLGEEIVKTAEIVTNSSGAFVGLELRSGNLWSCGIHSPNHQPSTCKSCHKHGKESSEHWQLLS